jgi:DNA-binding MarR family transcriptional regulator
VTIPGVNISSKTEFTDLISGCYLRNQQMNENGESDVDRVTRVANAYGERYPWADVDALRMYFRIDATSAALRAAGARSHSGEMPDSKRWLARIVRALYMAPDFRLSHANIAKETGVPAANVTYQVDALRDEGYVQRVPNQQDRRVTFVELTPKGLEFCERILPQWTQFMSELGQMFTGDEKRLLNDLLVRLQSAAEDYVAATDD